MKHVLFLIYTLIFLCTAALAQSDTITIKKKGGGEMYQMGGKTLSTKQLGAILSTDADATRQFKNGRDTRAAALVFAGAGGSIIGYSIGGFISSGKAINPIVICTGAVLFAISIPFSSSTQRNLRGAVETYNGKKRKTASLHFKPHIYFTLAANSAGFMMKF